MIKAYIFTKLIILIICIKPHKDIAFNYQYKIKNMFNSIKNKTYKLLPSTNVHF